MLRLDARAEAKRLFFNYYSARKTLPAPEGEAELLASGERLRIKYNGARVAAYSWGKGPKIIIGVHGIDGRGSQFSRFLPELQRAGYRVILYDAPGMANSPAKIVTTDQNRAVIAQLVHLVGAPYAFLSHCQGARWALYAHRHGIPVQKMICMSAPAQGRWLFDKWKENLDIAPEVEALLEHMMEVVDGPDVWRKYSPVLLAENVQVPGLVLHGSDDDIVPESDGRLLARAWRGAEFVSLQGCDHFSILEAKLAIDSVMDFLDA